MAPASVGYDAVNEYYANERDYVFAIAKALREEYLAVHEAGLVLQVDDAVLAETATVDPEWADEHAAADASTDDRRVLADEIRERLGTGGRK